MRNTAIPAGLAAISAALLGFGACVSTGGGGGGGSGSASSTAMTAGEANTTLKGTAAPVDEGPPVDGGTMIVHLESEPPHLNYLLQTGAWMARMLHHRVYQMLIRQNPYTYELEGELAESWELSDDKLTYTFHLRDGVKWHDGTPFTSADVEFTFYKILDDETAATHTARELLKPYVASYEAPDEKTFIIKMKKPYYFLYNNLDTLTILPKHIFEKGDFNTHKNNREPVGTGPFKFDHWTTGEEIVFVKNPDYWGKKAHLDRVVYRYVADRDTAFELVKRGEIDLLARMAPEKVVNDVTPELLTTVNHISYYPASFSFVMFNLNKPVFKDVRTRKAIRHLWNSKAIIKDLYFGTAKPIFSPYWLESASLHPTLKPHDFDPAAAGKLLAEAGWADTDKDGVLDKDGEKFAFDFLLTVNSQTLKKILTYVQNDFKKAGLEMRVTPIEWATFLKRLKASSFDMTALIWILNSPTSDFAQLFHSSQIGGGSNYGAFRSPRADELLEKIAVEFDDAKRTAMEHELQALLYEEVPYVFSMCTRIDSLANKRLKNVKPSLKWYVSEDIWSPADMARK